MAMWSDAVSPKIKQMAQAMVEGTEPTGEAQDLPDEVHIEQMRQWGFTVIPGVIPSDRLPACVCHLCLHCCVFSCALPTALPLAGCVRRWRRSRRGTASTTRP